MMTPGLKHYLQQRPLQNQQTPHIVTTTDIKTNMRRIHTSIVSMHLATIDNNKILRTPPPHISSSEETLLRLTRLTLAQLITNKSHLLKSYEVNANLHPSPLFPLCKTHPHNTHQSLQLHPYMHHIFCGQTSPEGRHCWSDGRRSCWWTTSGKIELPSQ